MAFPLAGGFLAACATPRTGTLTGGAMLARPAANDWPDFFRQASPEVQEAYRFAVANPEVVKHFPCFCGCVNDGHTSNLDCYVRAFRPDGSVVLDLMSFG